LIRSTNVWGYDELVRGLGGDPGPFRARHDIPPGVEDAEEAFVEFDSLSLLLEDTAETLRCPDLGLRLVEWQGLGILGPVAVIARNARDVGSGIEAIARYLHVHSPALRLSTGERDPGGDIAFRYEISGLPLRQQRQSYELSMANATRIVRLLSGGDAGPTSVSFMHERLAPLSSYRESLRAEVRFGQSWCGFVVPGEVLARPIDSADPETRRIATAYLEANYPPAGSTLAERVSELVRRLLPTGHFSADCVADQLHLHVRTLQRQLAEENLTYADILERQRRELVVHYLAEPKLQLGQIAALLGYAEQSALNRAFRRWFDTTPRQFRAEHVLAR